MSHTVLIVQSDSDVDSRTWLDFETVGDCMDGICRSFEEHLKQRNPHSQAMTYDISQLFDFIDRLTDISCFVSNRNQVYVSHNREWIKQQIYLKLSSQSAS
ncbi:unnamed protein product [Soboliphyme baturini]|uniref:Enhancer of rudimentary homolog n=1 Tax=Soboliphyme baturini TaxID=241478 RepID=A0A183ICZ4_9BILA|nr:unnamed protein product [Soboliphyme baturini]